MKKNWNEFLAINHCHYKTNEHNLYPKIRQMCSLLPLEAASPAKSPTNVKLDHYNLSLCRGRKRLMDDLGTLPGSIFRRAEKGSAEKNPPDQRERLGIRCQAK